MAEVLFLPVADADYQEALAWYQGRSAQAAAGFEATLNLNQRLQRTRYAGR